MAVAQIDRLMKQSNGGFGAYLMLAHNWADPEATKKSYELTPRRPCCKRIHNAACKSSAASTIPASRAPAR